MKRRRDAEANYTHTRQRLLERHGLQLDRTSYTQLCLACKYQRLKRAPSRSGEIVFLWEYQDKVLLVVWNSETSRVETVLP